MVPDKTSFGVIRTVQKCYCSKLNRALVWILIVHMHEEIVRVPKCPVASSPMFFAGSILGLSTLGLLLGRRMPVGSVKCWWHTKTFKNHSFNTSFGLVVAKPFCFSCYIFPC